MKKSIIALAVLAAGFAQADGTTLYGTFDTEYKISKAGEADAIGHLDNSVLLGLKGEDALGNGMKAFYSLEYDKYFDNENVKGDGSDNDAGGPSVKLGLETGFGTFVAGKNDLPSKAIASDQTEFFGELDSSKIKSAVEDADHSLAYVSPDFSGFKVVGGIISNENVGEKLREKKGYNAEYTNKDNEVVKPIVDGFDVTAAYSANGIYAGVGYLATTDDPATIDGQITLGAGYGNDMFTVGAKTQWIDEFKYGRFLVAGKYNVMPNASVYADFNGANEDTGDNFNAGIGGTYAFDDKLSALAEYRYTHLANAAEKNENNSEVALGATYKFSKQTESWAKYQYNDGFGVDNAESHDVKVGLKSSF